MKQLDRRREILSVDEAVSRILARIGAMPARSVPLAGARGLVLAEEIVAGSNSPRFNTSAMDGYAVRHADIQVAAPERPVRLPVRGAIAAGMAATPTVTPGSAVRIMTGAECPAGTELVIPFELVTERAGEIEIPSPLPAGANIRRAGEDITAGSPLLAPGTRLCPAHLALIAAEGRADVTVIPRPRVAIVATGDELVPPGTALEPGQIWDSNSVMLAALLEQFGAVVVSMALVADEPAVVLDAVRKQVADAADLVLTIGGASRGDRDVLAEIAGSDFQIECWDVLMKPGRPLVVGRVGDIPLVGLPGNPAAAFVSAIQFLRPAMLRMLGRRDIAAPVVFARVAESISNPGGRRTFVRVVLDSDESGVVARSAGAQNVANLATLARADGLLIVPEAMSVVEPGAQLAVHVLRDL